jgi:hypothetical protein
LPWNIWDPGINYPALIPIIAHAYLLLMLSPMHALSSPPGINHFTHRTVHNRQGKTASVRTCKELTRNWRPATCARRRAPSLVYNPHPF